MIRHESLSQNQIIDLIKKGEVRFAGNQRLKIYGTLTCASGKKMKKENRVFFKDAAEATGLGFRPCGHCMRKQYIEWKKIG
jgi:methylphosphotriester-DNA--protein-cysteine methyltransferase